MSGEIALGGGLVPRSLLTGLLALGLFMIYAPVVYLLLASFNPGVELGLVPPSDFSLVWYRALMSDDRLLSALVESALVGVTTAAVAAPVGFSGALAFRAMTAHRGPFFLFILSAMFVPGTIQGLGLSVIFKVLAVKPSWLTVVAGHLLWSLPFAFTVSLVSLAVVSMAV
jgi:spermidine/putrescine transport system permease protein